MEYFKRKIENLISISRIITIHYFEFDRHFKWSGEEHDFWELVYADKGDIICTIGDRDVVLHEGQMVFYKPNVHHSLRANGLCAPNVFVMSFVSNSDNMHFFDDKILDINPKRKDVIYSIVRLSKKTFDIPFSDPDSKKMELLETPVLGGLQLLKNYMEILLIDIMGDQESKDGAEKVFLTDREIKDKLVEEVVDYLKDNIYGTVSVSEITTYFNYSKAHIFKEFKKSTNDTLMDYYTKLKIDEAKRLLRESDISISEISDRLCFSTPNYFTKVFFKHVGATPTRYKDRLNKLN